MTLTPFIDSLMVDQFDTFKIVIADFKDIKATLKNDNRRVNKPVLTYTAYEFLKTITDAIQRVFNGRRIKDDKALSLFVLAVRKVNLLVRQLREYGRDTLASALEALEQRLLALLPSNTPVQLELFDVERFETGSKEACLFAGFRSWKRDALYRQMQRVRNAVCQQADHDEQTKIERLRTMYSGIKKGVEIVQQSIRFS